jgi:nucleoside-diphosphate-sugar epimerase
MRVLVIGGTGFIGRPLVEQLIAAGHETAVLHRGQTPAARGARDFVDPAMGRPLTAFPDEALAFTADTVVHMIAMGEAEGRAAAKAFAGHAGRIVAVSSGDVYLAYGRLIGTEPGPPAPVPLTEFGSPLRSALYPYRSRASEDDLLWWYEKILMERAVAAEPSLSPTILRLPKVYGPGKNADLATVYGYADHPDWRWTHGYVENVAAAIALAATDPRAAGRTYNVGEADTPTVAERLAGLPPSNVPLAGQDLDFRQDIVFDTSLIRDELGFAEPVSYEEGIRRSLSAGSPPP